MMVNTYQPELVHTFINHRISASSSYQELEAHYTEVLTPVAKMYNVSLEAFGELQTGDENSPAAGKATFLEAFSSQYVPCCYSWLLTARQLKPSPCVTAHC